MSCFISIETQATPIIGDKTSAKSYLVSNEFIEKGYRINYTTWSQTFKSLFEFHNETVNTWTHLVGFLLMVPLLFNIKEDVPHTSISENLLAQGKVFFAGLNLIQLDSHDLKLAETVTIWPLVAFILSACCCLFFSTICHLTGCKSQTTDNIVCRLDYIGIVTLCLGGAYPIVQYKFACGRTLIFWRHVFTVFLIIATFGVIFTLTCKKFDLGRPISFTVFGLAVILPLVVG